MRICVYGAASNTIDEFYIKEGEKLGRLLALHGHGLVYGAGATGLMGAVLNLLVRVLNIKRQTAKPAVALY